MHNLVIQQSLIRQLPVGGSLHCTAVASLGVSGCCIDVEPQPIPLCGLYPTLRLYTLHLKSRYMTGAIGARLEILELFKP